jgi:hypothetical protein
MTIVERRKEEKEALRMCGGFVTYILSVPYLSYIRLRLRWAKAACTIAHVVQNGKEPAEAELKTTPIVAPQGSYLPLGVALRTSSQCCVSFVSASPTLSAVTLQ